MDLLVTSSGYPPEQFLVPPPSSMLCTKCQKVLMNPYLLSCCEIYLCENCLLHVQLSNDKRCPSCGKIDYDFGSSISMKEEIEALPVRCTNSRKSCKWEGQLRELDIHLLIYCPYTEIDCEHKCGIKFMRRDLSLHQCPIQPSPDPPIANGTSNSPSTVEGLSQFDSLVGEAEWWLPWNSVYESMQIQLNFLNDVVNQ